MEKRKWLWKKRSSEKSPGESESSGSISSYSERYSDEQDASKDSPNHSTHSPEITSKSPIADDELEKNVKSLTEKLSAALVNVSAKEDLVKQHAKVAEEAVAGWERAENEVVSLKQQLDTAIQQNLNLEVRSSHLDGALKECVRQLRQARETMAQLEAAKTEQTSSIDANTLLKLEALEKENSSLKQELICWSKEVEIRTIERDLSTRAAETASKLQLENIKKITKLEAECRKLQAWARKSPSSNDHKPIMGSSFCVESLTDSHSDNGLEKSCSDSWASALIAELDQFKNEKSTPKNLTTCSVEIDMMDDFLEMERLAALPEIKNSISSVESTSTEKSLSEELERVTGQVARLEEELEKMKTEKTELENALDQSRDSLDKSEAQLAESEMKIEELQRDLSSLNEAKELLEFQLIGMEVEARTMSANIGSLKEEIAIERNSSAEVKLKCQELENELNRINQEKETEIQHNADSNGELKLKQEDLAVAADKLAECQKTIASLGRQLQSLATLEDFLIDTANLPGFSRGTAGDLWRIHSNDATFVSKCDSDPSKTPLENSTCLNNEESPASSSSSNSSANPTTSGKMRNGFGKFFSRTRSGIELENHQG